VLAEWFKQPGDVLIHCAAGQTRSVNTAILAKVARGCDPFTATKEVLEAVWTGYKVLGNPCHAPLKDVVDWWASRAH
jgi:protein-tyrosine phosphatase